MTFADEQQPLLHGTELSITDVDSGAEELPAASLPLDRQYLLERVYDLDQDTVGHP